MQWLDRTLGLACVVLLVGCSDDGFLPPADPEVGTTSGGVTAGQSTTQADAGGDTGDGGGDSGDDGASAGAETTGEEGTTGPSGDTSTGEEPPPEEMVCIDETDCVLINDCCACAAVHVDEDYRECELDCDTPMCDVLGIPDIGVVCEDEQCELESRNCSPALITCDGIPPRCPEGTAPEVTPEGDCWTDACIPVEACDGVPGCEYCPDDEVCVTNVGMVGPEFLCEPLPEACMEEATCECAAELCVDPFDSCAAVDGVLECTCLRC